MNQSLLGESGQQCISPESSKPISLYSIHHYTLQDKIVIKFRYKHTEYKTRKYDNTKSQVKTHRSDIWK